MTSNLLICTACGTQFDTTNPQSLRRCYICDDPRQFVPPTGQSFTTLSKLQTSSEKYTNKFLPFSFDSRFTSIWTEPKLAIGQRCVLVETPLGNILWDCITYLDDDTIAKIKEMGGLAAIVISHPHYYTTHLEWAATFDCPVYMSSEDMKWLSREDKFGVRRLIEGKEEDVLIHGEKSGVKALKLGGHFPGSLCVLAFGRLLVADTLVTTPSGLGDWSKGPGEGEGGRPNGMSSYAFMWSIPNMIPLNAEEIEEMWDVLKNHEFESTHGAFVGTELRDGHGGSALGVKRRVLDSMQISVRRISLGHAFLKETI